MLPMLFLSQEDAMRTVATSLNENIVVSLLSK